MKLGRLEYALVRFAHSAPWLLQVIGEFETRLLHRRLASIQMDRPVFITGLARSGTTILLNLLAQAESVATHRYRDFPFVLTPYVWHRFLDRFAREQAPVERPHRDRIYITRESPEAFEELIWQYFFPRAHHPAANHILSADLSIPEFEQFFISHIRKILLIRNGSRYVSKGNYNVTRIELLNRLFPDALFLISVRHPINHVTSLVNQHRLFRNYSMRDSRVPKYLRAAGHYEFGPQRVPINFHEGGSRRLRDAWESGDDHKGYAILWTDIYRYVAHLTAIDQLKDRTMVLRHEDLCSRPIEVARNLINFSGLEQGADQILNGTSQVSALAQADEKLPVDTLNGIWKETGPIARNFGYNRYDFA